MSKGRLVFVVLWCVLALSCTKSGDSEPAAPTAATRGVNEGGASGVQVPLAVVESPNFLHDKLVNTTYAWNGEDNSLTFRQDGTIGKQDWEDRHIVTRWKPIDRRTVLLFIDKGRDENRYAILTFSDDLGSYTGYNFEHGSLLALSLKK